MACTKRILDHQAPLATALGDPGPAAVRMPISERDVDGARAWDRWSGCVGWWDGRVGTSRRAPVISAVIGCAALAVYAGLKAVWAVGGQLGVRDPAEWQHMLGGLTRGQLFITFWGTVLLDAAGAALLITLAMQPARLARSLTLRVLRALGWVGGAGLAAAGLVGLAVSIGPATGLWRSAPGSAGPLSDWVFIVVYGAFFTVGVALLVTTTRSRPTGRGDRPSASVS